MAWQTPKTNWTGADGVRFGDLNRIEGNIAELLALIESNSGLNESTTVWVSKSGSDTAGNGTSSQPYLTVNKAVSVLPKNIGGQVCIINVAAGNYAEDVAIHDFYGGAVLINGVSGAAVTFRGLHVENCSVLVSDIALTVGSTGIFIGAKGMLYSASSRITVTGATTGITLRYGAVMEITPQLTINNATNVAILAQYGSTASVGTVTGTGNNIAVYLYQSTVYASVLSLTANILVVNENGAFYQKGAVG